MSIIGPTEFKNAKHSIENLKPAIDALNKIDKQTVQNDTEVLFKIEEFKQFISQVHVGYQAIIDQGNLQYQNRDEKLVNRAAMRLNQISRDIEKEKNTFQCRVRAYQSKAEELTKKGFSNFEINQIVPPITQQEIDAHESVFVALELEKRALEEFLRDAPRYDIGILRNTSIYPTETVSKAA